MDSDKVVVLSERKRRLGIVLIAVGLFLLLVVAISAIELQSYFMPRNLKGYSQDIHGPQIRKLLEFNSSPHSSLEENKKCFIPTNRNTCAPQFIIAGAMKCGTTSLYGYLSHHPDILPLGESSEDIYLGKKLSESNLSIQILAQY